MTWNMTANYSQSVQGYSATGTYSWTGQLDISSSTIVGLGRSAFSGHGTSGSVTFDYQYTSGFDANLGYQASPSYCLSSGTLQIRRTLNETTNAGAVPVHDAGALYTWSGCGSVGVSPGH